MYPLLIFLAGFVCGLATWLLWRALGLLHDLRRARQVAANYDDVAQGPRDLEAIQAVRDCKSRLRWQKRLNPEWLPPLIEEVPRLVRQIAEIYHPMHPEPLLAPGLSQFFRAVHLASMDIADFLQAHSLGRLVDVSASTALRTWEMTHKVATHETMKRVTRWYRRLLPVWQTITFKSPMMWAGMAVSNAAARTLQPIIVDLIAHRAIDLYSGRVAKPPGETLAPSVLSGTGESG